MIGAFNCECSPGFEISDSSVPPVVLKPSSAVTSQTGRIVEEQNARFINLIAVSLECRDIDECSQDINPCTGQNDNAQNISAPVCANTVGSFECSCPKGYTHSPELKACVDIDECLDPVSYLCDITAGEECVNTPGSYLCQCAPGYRPSQWSSRSVSPAGLLELECEDIDECTEGTHKCVDGCRNIPGSYKCECPKGFTPDPDAPHQCRDINECEHRLCPDDTPCINLPGSYICGCPKGHKSESRNPDFVVQLSKDLQRWLKAMDEQSRTIASAKKDSLRSKLIDWNSSEFSLRVAKLRSELANICGCIRIDVCSHFSGWDLCPQSSTCVQESAEFQCQCPKGSRLSTTGSAPEKVISPSSPVSNLPGTVLGGFASGLIGLLGRQLEASDEWKSSDLNNSTTIEEVLTTEDLNVGMAVGLIQNPLALSSPSEVPLWLITQIDWSRYISSGTFLKSSRCAHINECLEGINGDFSALCGIRAPCCYDMTVGYSCETKRGLLQTGCPRDSVDLSAYLK